MTPKNEATTVQEAAALVRDAKAICQEAFGAFQTDGMYRLSQQCRSELARCRDEAEIDALALSKCDQALAIDPYCASALHTKAAIIGGRGASVRPQLIQILECLIEALQVRPIRSVSLADAMLELGDLYLSEYRFAEAETILRRAVELNPAIHVHCALLRCILRRTGVDSALAYWESLRDSPLLRPREVHTALAKRAGEPPYIDDTALRIWQSKHEDLLKKQARGYVYRPRKRAELTAAPRKAELGPAPKSAAGPPPFTQDTNTGVRVSDAAATGSGCGLPTLLLVVMLIAWWVASLLK